jgi:hypothetical protein
VLYEFMRWRAHRCQGMLDTRPCHSTLRTYFNTFVSAWKDAVGKALDEKGIVKRVREAMRSSEYLELGTTASRAKPVASTDDVRLALEAVVFDTGHLWCSFRHRIQIAALLVLVSIWAERIGTVIESSAYFKTNSSVKYGNLHFYHGLDHQTGQATIFVTIEFEFLKKHRENKAETRSISAYAESSELRHMCPVFLLLVLALLDGVLSFDDLVPPPLSLLANSRLVPIPIRIGYHNKLVFQNIDLRSGNIDPKRALPYEKFYNALNKISAYLGLACTLSPPSVRLTHLTVLVSRSSDSVLSAPWCRRPDPRHPRRGTRTRSHEPHARFADHRERLQVKELHR